MEVKSKLSLNHWPKQPLQSKDFTLSPTLSKLLRQTNIHLQDIIPISYEEFLNINDLTQNKLSISSSQGQYYDQYQNQIRRRKTQVDILKAINQKRKNQTYVQVQSRSRLKQKVKLKCSHSDRKVSVVSSRSNNYNYYKQSQKQNKKEKQKCEKEYSDNKESRKLVKSRSQKSNHVVFSFFPKNNHNHNHEIQGKPYIQEYFGQFPKKQKEVIFKEREQESITKSRKTVKNIQNKSRKISSIHNNQYELQPKTNIKSRKHLYNESKALLKQKQICKQLILTVQDYNQVDSRHQQQFKRISKCDNKSRERLLKIQSIQKNQIRQKIKSLRKRLDSTSKK